MTQMKQTEDADDLRPEYFAGDLRNGVRGKYAERLVQGAKQPHVRQMIADRYQRFAAIEANGVSPLYAQVALAIAQSDELLGFVATLPPAKQQPNLVLAAVRHLYGTPRDAVHFAELVQGYGDAIRAVILARSTQTNEPARCATLLPLLCQLPQPLALIEIGAAGGLCLWPDRWGYDYGRVKLAPPRSDAPVFACKASEATPLPTAHPQIVWRAGLDLNPLDLRNPDATAWLETLVWPEQEARAERLRAAIATVRDEPPVVRRGDLLADLAPLAAQAPPDATLVVFHSAVLSYLEPQQREQFAEQVLSLRATWISNEAPGVFPAITARSPVPPPPDRFLLSCNGEPVAFTGPHGQSIQWVG